MLTWTQMTPSEGCWQGISGSRLALMMCSRRPHAILGACAEAQCARLVPTLVRPTGCEYFSPPPTEFAARHLWLWRALAPGSGIAAKVKQARIHDVRKCVIGCTIFVCCCCVCFFVVCF